VGLAVRFALSRLVSRARGAVVDSVTLDEPFAALDRDNLRSAVSLVADALGSYGIRQCLLVSHLPEVQDACGDVLTVVREGDLSRAEVSW
jgi:DNA repair exonuclease SbcCD ATPase subunit